MTRYFYHTNQYYASNQLCVCVSLSSQEHLTLRDVLGLFHQGRHHPTALFVLRSLVPLLREKSIGGMFKGTGVKLTQLVPGGCVRWVCFIGVSC